MAMKMRPEHYKALEDMIALFGRQDTVATREAYRKAGLSSKRYRWDALWSVPHERRTEWFDLGIYEYLNDDHIDTALRAIFQLDW